MDSNEDSINNLNEHKRLIKILTGKLNLLEEKLL